MELRHAMFWRLQHPLGTFARYWQNGLAPLDQRYPKRDFKTWTPESSFSSTPTPESIRLPTPAPETVGWTTTHTPQLKQHVTRTSWLNEDISVGQIWFFVGGVTNSSCSFIPMFIDSKLRWFNHSTLFQEYIPCARCGIRFFLKKKTGFNMGSLQKPKHTLPILSPCGWVAWPLGWPAAVLPFQQIWGLVWRSWGKVGETLF